MIVDCHTHLWTNPAQLGHDAEAYLQREGGDGLFAARDAEHYKAAECVDKALVMGYRSAHLEAAVPNELIGSYVARHSRKMIGIAGVDPTEPDATDTARELLSRQEFRGLTISPATQNFHPADSRAIELYELAAEAGVPIFISQGTHFPPKGRMEYARPLLFDEIAREFPHLSLVIAALGHPWVEEGIALIGKHGRVFGNVASLLRRPWQAYNALVLAHQYNVMDKVLFGSDFPYLRAADAIKAVYRLHEVTQGTNLPSVPRETLRGMIERNSLTALGIARADECRESEPATEDQL
ncbi:MAG: amidohydrolase family protein [Planctomycetota bacterium]